MKKYLVMLSTRIDITTAQALDAYAEASGITKSAIVEDAIKAYLVSKGGKK
jgi:predicted transcriptional regulator